MRYLTFFLLFISIHSFAQDKEGDLQLPVSDLEIEKQEEELPPTIDQVETHYGKQKQSESNNHRNRGSRPHGSEDTEGKKY